MNYRILSLHLFAALVFFGPAAYAYNVNYGVQAHSNQDPNRVILFDNQNDGATSLSADTGTVPSDEGASARAAVAVDLFTGTIAMTTESSFNSLATATGSFTENVSVTLPPGMSQATLTANLEISGSASGAFQSGTLLNQTVRIDLFAGPSFCSEPSDIAEIGLRDVTFPTTISASMIVREGCLYAVWVFGTSGTWFTSDGPSQIIVTDTLSLSIDEGVEITSESGVFLGANDDSDDDGVIAAIDNCLATANAGQIDADGDGYGNACDADLNNDCVVNVLDLGLLRTVFFSADASADFNSDGTVNIQDLGIMRTRFFEAPGPSADESLCSD